MLRTPLLRDPVAAVAALISAQVISARLLTLVGTLFWVNLSESPNDGTSAIAGPKAVAVLPFDNFSDDIGQDYFADGLTDNLITSSLAQLSDLFVIARDSTFLYKGETLEPHEVAAKLNARYLVYGGVRRTAMNGWSDARKSSLRHAIGLATRAVEIDEAMPVAYFLRGISYRELGEPEKAAAVNLQSVRVWL